MSNMIFVMLILAFTSMGLAAEGEYDEIAKQIEEKIRSEDKVEIERLKVLHTNGTVYLEGVAKQFGSKYLAGKIAEEQKAINKVDNQIAVTSVQVSDEEIQLDLIARIRKHLRNEPFDSISVKSSGGYVTLMGDVRDASLIDRAFKEAIWVRGVRGVENKIEATPPSSADDRLRRTILRILSAQFPRYFAGRPSVLIVVNSGRVKLIGYVSSGVEKEKMASAVRSVIGVISVENQLQVQ